MASTPLLPALTLEPAALEPLATISVLNALRSIASPLQEVFPDWPEGHAAGMDSLLQRTGSAVVFQGHPSTARHLDGLLRKAGLTTSVNWLHQPAIAPEPEPSELPSS